LTSPSSIRMGSPPWTKASMKPDQFNSYKLPSKEQGWGSEEEKIVHVFRSVVHQLLTTVRNPSKVVSGHFRPAESNCDIHLSIALLVVARLARTSPISEGEKFRPHIFTSCANTSQLPSEFRRGLFLDLFDASNLPVPSVCPWHHWLF
jgi:hypothetical protein